MDRRLRDDRRALCGAGHDARLLGLRAAAGHQHGAGPGAPRLLEGLRAAVGQRIKAAGFKPDPAEQGNWWDVPSRLQPSRQRHGR